jgi:hypothetical protein
VQLPPVDEDGRLAIEEIPDLIPTSMLATTASVAVSTTDTVDAPSLLTNTLAPSGVITRPCGPAGMAMVRMRRLLPVSITARALSPNRPT